MQSTEPFRTIHDRLTRDANHLNGKNKKKHWFPWCGLRKRSKYVIKNSKNIIPPVSSRCAEFSMNTSNNERSFPSTNHTDRLWDSEQPIRASNEIPANGIASCADGHADVSDVHGSDLLTIDDSSGVNKVVSILKGTLDRTSHNSSQLQESSYTFDGDDMMGNVNEVSADVKYIVVTVPSEGVDKEGMSITVNNPTDTKLAYKVKCTQTKRFKVGPSTGFIDACGKEVIEFQPRQFHQYDYYGFNPSEALSIHLLPITSVTLTRKGNHGWKCAAANRDNENETVIRIPILYALKDHKGYGRKLVRGKKGFRWTGKRMTKSRNNFHK